MNNELLELPHTDTSSTPTTAHQTTLALLYGVLEEAARRRQHELPGLLETLQDDVVVTTGGTARPAYGWFAQDAWRYGDRQVHELFLNADRRIPHPFLARLRMYLSRCCMRAVIYGHRRKASRTHHETVGITTGCLGRLPCPSAWRLNEMQ